MTKQPEHPGYAPLDEPEGSGVNVPDTYLYKVQERRFVVLCPPCARQFKNEGERVTVLKDSNSECIVCCNGNLGRVSE